MYPYEKSLFMVPTYIFISKTAFYFYISIFKLIFTLPGRDWAQSGVAQLFTKIKNNGYHIMYLSARAIGQASITKDYLHSVKQVSCDQYFGSALFFMWIRTRAKIVMRIRVRNFMRIWIRNTDREKRTK